MMFAARRLQELGRKAHVPLFLCFIDLQKAYDSVDHTLLWQAPARFETPPQIKEVIRQFHDRMREHVYKVMTADARSGSRGHRGSVRDAYIPRCCSMFSSLRYSSSYSKDSARTQAYS